MAIIKYFNNISKWITLSPDAFLIAFDVNYFIKLIVVRFDKRSFATEKCYVMENGDDMFGDI